MPTMWVLNRLTDFFSKRKRRERERDASVGVIINNYYQLTQRSPYPLELETFEVDL